MEQNYYILDPTEFCSIQQYVKAAEQTLHVHDYENIAELGLV